MIDTIIFDAEGVVIDTEDLWDQAQRELLDRRGIRYDRARLKPMLTGRSSLEGARVICDVLDLDEDPEKLARERTEIMQGIVRGDIEFIEGFIPFFNDVRHRFKTCLATAMDPALLETADRTLGLSDLFDGHVVTLKDVGWVGKPAPDLFLEAARRVDAEPGECLVIEDAPHGIEAARRAGMRSVGLATTYLPEQLRGADQVCATFDEIDLDEEVFSTPFAGT